MDVPNANPHKRQDHFRFYSRANCSLTRRERKNAFLLMAATVLLIASVFGWLGYWVVLPFAGLEIGVLAWVFDYLGKHSGDYESIRIRDDEILVVRRQGRQVERHALNCQWARLVLARAGQGRVRLTLRSHGREIELGTFLTDEARLRLAEELPTTIKRDIRHTQNKHDR